MKPLLVALVLLLASLVQVPAQAQTVVSGPITGDTTWTREGSPYVLEGVVTVEQAARLAVEPGVVVQAAEDDNFVAEGVIEVRGSPEDPAIFTVEDGAETWQGISFARIPRDAYPPVPDSSFEHARFENAGTALLLDVRRASIESSEFSANDVAIRVQNPPGALEIRSSVFTHNDTAIVGRTRDVVHVSTSDFWNNRINLLMEPQAPFDCGRDEGLWDVHRNDILLGPANRGDFSGFDPPGSNYVYRPYDVRTTEGSMWSPYAISATDNWWGSDDPDEIVPRVESFRCCPGDTNKRIAWRPPSQGPNTPWEPDGEVLLAYTDLFHGDPAWIAAITHPRHGDCFRRRDLTSISGVNFSALSPPGKPEVALKKIGRGSCSWWDERAAGFRRGRCDRPLRFRPDTVRRQGSIEWTHRFPRPLPRGRYTVYSYEGRSDATTVGRNEMSFRLTR